MLREGSSLVMGICAVIAFSMSMIGFELAEADAYSWRTCNGDPVTWGSGDQLFEILQCSFPTDSTERDDAEDMMDRWNSMGATEELFVPWNNFSCTADRGNDKNEVYVVDLQYLDGAIGLAQWEYDSSCWWFGSSQEIIEVDVLIADQPYWPTSTPGTPPFFKDLDYWHLGDLPCTEHHAHREHTALQSVLFHEFGHAIGLRHEEKEPAHMTPTEGGEIAFCHDPRVQPNPDDAAGGRFLRPGSGEVKNLSASAFEYVPQTLELPPPFGEVVIGGNIRRADNDDIIAKCPGQEFTLSWTAANNGTEDLEFCQAWYFSTNTIPGDEEIPLSGGCGAFQSGESRPGTFPRTLTVPGDHRVDYDTSYYVYTHLDNIEEHDQLYTLDTYAHSATKVYVPPESMC